MTDAGNTAAVTNMEQMFHEATAKCRAPTTADDPEGLQPRTLPETFPGDLCVVEGAGAYCAAMSAKNYNSFPEAPEVLVGLDGQPRLIRRRQSLEQVFQNEVDG